MNFGNSRPRLSSERSHFDWIEMADRKSESKYNIQWNRHGVNTVESLNQYLRSEYLTDMVLSCDGYSIKCHRLILASSSYYFERLLSTRRNCCSDLVVILKDITYPDMVSALHFIYEGQVLLAENEIHSFLKTAENLELKGITENARGRWDQTFQTRESANIISKGDKVCDSEPERQEIHVAKVADNSELKDANIEIVPHELRSDRPSSPDKVEKEKHLPGCNSVRFVSVSNIVLVVDPKL